MKRLKMNVQTKMMITSEKARKVRKEGKLLFGVCREGIGRNDVLCQFCNCWVHKDVVLILDLRNSRHR